MLIFCGSLKENDLYMLRRLNIWFLNGGTVGKIKGNDLAIGVSIGVEFECSKTHKIPG